MQPLERSYRIFTWLCICPPDTSASEWIKLKNILFSILALFFLSTANVSSFAYAIKYFHVDLANSLCATYQLAGLFSTFHALLTAYVVRDDITNTFVAFRNFYNASK